MEDIEEHMIFINLNNARDSIHVSTSMEENNTAKEYINAVIIATTLEQGLYVFLKKL